MPTVKSYQTTQNVSCIFGSFLSTYFQEVSQINRVRNQLKHFVYGLSRHSHVLGVFILKIESVNIRNLKQPSLVHLHGDPTLLTYLLLLVLHVEFGFPSYDLLQNLWELSLFTVLSHGREEFFHVELMHKFTFYLCYFLESITLSTRTKQNDKIMCGLRYFAEVQAECEMSRTLRTAALAVEVVIDKELVVLIQQQVLF